MIFRFNMNKGKQRIALAQLDDWKLISLSDEEPEYKTFEKDGEIGIPPDYHNDLNATHALLLHCSENVMNSDQWEELGRQLEVAHPTAILAPGMMSGGDDGSDYYELACIFTISAEDICGAILKTLNLWESE